MLLHIFDGGFLRKMVTASSFSQKAPEKCLPRLYPAGNYIFKVNNRNTITRCEIC